MTRVLVAEDSPTQAQELELGLVSEGYEVTLCADGDSALALLADEAFDIVLSDVQMPGMTGYELCRSIKANPQRKDIPVILLTRLSETLDIVRGLECGADDFITKPYETTHLIERIQALRPHSAEALEPQADEGVEFECMGSSFTIRTRREPMFNFLMSTFAELLTSKKRELEGQLAAEKRRREELGALTEELQATNAKLTKLASVDPLTELLNRRGVERVLTIETSRGQRSGSQLVAALVDLDSFKRINDQLGHAVGDIVLTETAKRLSSSLRPSDRVGRVGGDEFLILLPDTGWGEAQTVANRVRLAITESPLVIFDDVIRMTASLGIAVLPPETCSIEEVLTLTRQGLRDAKSSGGNRVCSTGSGNGNGNGVAADSVEDIRRLLKEEGAFRAVSQPIYNLVDDSLAGYELLSRGPEGAYEMPTDFFRICLEGNFLTTMDLQCLKNCVAASAHLEPAGRYHVNLFPSTLLDTPPERLIDLLKPTGNGVFCVEISEQQFISDPACLMDHVTAFRNAGILVAMDDVGFGRSSLEALIVLEPDLVKIDPKCVIGISQNSDRAHSMRRIIKVAESLDAELVAEGIESPEDLKTLREMGVGFGQGFLWGQPS